MASNRITSRGASVLPLIGIALALANWYAQPRAAWAWAAAAAMCVVMIAVLRFWQRALRRSPANAALVRSVAEVRTGVAFGGVMMIIPLAVTLAHAYGVVDDPHSGQRMTMVVLGTYLALLGNAMPRSLPPASVMQDNGARIQAFQRMIGWTWALGGLGFAAAWAELPLAATGPVSMTLVAAAVIVTIVQLFRLRTVRVSRT